MMDTEWLVVLTPVLIFLARSIDVSIGTVRIICISRNYRLIAAMLGFVEILVWLIAISQVMKNLNSWINYVAYAGGFAMGNFVGVTIERRIAMGRVVFRIIAQDDIANLMQNLQLHGYGLTVLDGQGSKGPVKVIFMICARKDIGFIEDLIHDSLDKVFYSIEDVRRTEEGVFPNQPSMARSLVNRFKYSILGK